MHYHIDWSSAGFGSEFFGSYADAIDAARHVVEENSASQSKNRPLSTSNETFKIELFDQACQVCAKHAGAR